MKHVLVFAMIFCAFGAFAHPPVDSMPRVAIVSAFGPEISKLKSVATIEKDVSINGRNFTLARLEGREVVMFLSGVSMVNAAMTVQVAVDHFSLTHILFSGIAGGVNPALNVGDVVIPAKWAQYQESVFARETPKGFDPAWHKIIFPNYGMMFTQEVGVTHGRLDKVDAVENKFWFNVDPKLLEVAGKIQSVQLASSTKSTKLTYAPKLVVGGNGVSGMTFVDNAKYRDWAFSTFRADCLDMETAAVSHVAYIENIPFLAFRSLSDLAGGGPGENEIGTFFGLAADNAAEVLIQFMKNWK